MHAATRFMLAVNSGDAIAVEADVRGIEAYRIYAIL